jgi:hypothetical protein
VRLTDAYRDGLIKFRDTREGDEWVIYATKGGKTGVGRGPYAPIRAHHSPGFRQATQQAIDDLERQLNERGK